MSLDDEKKVDYRDTLLLPNTDLPMRANLPDREPDFLSKWNKDDLFSKIRKSSKGKKKFILHDGPPYANGNLHMGLSLIHI